MPPPDAFPHVVVPITNQGPVLLHEPYRWLPASHVPGNASFHAHAVLLSTPADESAYANIMAQLFFVKQGRIVTKRLQGLLAESSPWQHILIRVWTC